MVYSGTLKGFWDSTCAGKGKVKWSVIEIGQGHGHGSINVMDRTEEQHYSICTLPFGHFVNFWYIELPWALLQVFQTTARSASSLLNNDFDRKAGLSHFWESEFSQQTNSTTIFWALTHFLVLCQVLSRIQKKSRTQSLCLRNFQSILETKACVWTVKCQIVDRTRQPRIQGLRKLLQPF